MARREGPAAAGGGKAPRQAWSCPHPTPCPGPSVWARATWARGADSSHGTASGGPPVDCHGRPRARRQRPGGVEQDLALVRGARRDADVAWETERGAVAYVDAAGEECFTDGRGVANLHEEEVGGGRQRIEAEVGEPGG